MPAWLFLQTPWCLTTVCVQPVSGTPLRPQSAVDPCFVIGTAPPVELCCSMSRTVAGYRRSQIYGNELDSPHQLG